MKRRLIWVAAIVVVAAVAATLVTGAPVLPERRSSVPTAISAPALRS